MNKEERNVPKLRFPTFSEPWKKRKLGELTERVQGNDGRMDLPTLTVSAGNGWMAQEDRFNRNMAGSEQKRYTLLKQGELSYNHGNSKLAKYGVVFVLQTYEEALVPRVYHSFRMINGNDAKFCEYVFETKRPDKELSKLISSGARMDGLLNINYEDFMGINVMIPEIKEQRLIRHHLEKFDTLITLQQRKLDQIKEYKKGMLQKMFPKEGETVPEVRFPGFSGEWELRKVGDTCRINGRIGFRGYTEKDIIPKEAGGVLTLSPTNIIDNKLTKNCKNTYITREKYEESPEIMVRNGDILFVKTGSTLGKSALVIGLMEDASINPQIVVIRVKEGTEAFMSNVFVSQGIMKQISAVRIGGAVPTMTETELKNFEYYTPVSHKEQKLIGDFFSNLDSLISLHQRKLEEMKEYKKGLLQQMFV